MSRFHGVDSEVGTLRTVIVHRPGAELKRVLPRDTGQLLFAQLPWAARAQQEHDMFTQVLRDHGVQVLYLTELLQDVLEYSPARRQAIEAALGAVTLGDELTGQVRRHLDGLDPEALTEVLIAGLTAGEFGGRGVVYQLLPGSDFLIEPLPNLVFFRDCGVWIGDRVAVASPAAPDRRVHAQLTDVIYAHHPLFAGTKSLYRPGAEPMEGGDVLLLAPGVIAAGSSPAGVARLARHVFDAGLAHTVLVVPLGHPGRRLDTACTMVGADMVLMRPAAAYSLTTRVLTPGGDSLRASHPQAFLVSAAQAAGLDRLRVIETGLGPAAAGREQWDDAGNLLVLGPGLVVSHERNVASHARLERCGVEVITVPGSELCGVRGGPRSLCCPVSRDPALLPGDLYPESSQGVLSVVAWNLDARRDKVRHVELNVSSRYHDDHTIVTICGEIDLYTAPRLHSELAAVLVDGMPARVVIDMSGVEFCDSTGMNVLLSCLRRVRERGGELEIASPKPAVRKILQVTGLDSVFTLVDDANMSRPKPAVPQ